MSRRVNKVMMGVYISNSLFSSSFPVSYPGRHNMRVGMPVVNVEGYYSKHDRYSHHHQDTVEIFGYSSVEATK